MALNEVKGCVMLPGGPPACHWMRLSIRKNNIYGLGLGI